MSIKVVQLDPNKDGEMLEFVSTHLFNEWGPHYINFFDEISSPETLAQYYKTHPETRTYVVISGDGKIMGWYSFTQRGKLHWMSDVYVVPEMRKQGVGRFIVQNAQTRHDKIAIQVEDKMISFYEKYGFQQGQMFMYKGKRGQDFYYRDMLWKKDTGAETSPWTMLIVMLCLLGIGLIGVIIIL